VSPTTAETQTQAVSQTSPIGGVQAGAGGTAPGPGDDHGIAFALAGGALLLLLGGGARAAWARTRGR
jgi:hypothetical protein